MKPRTQTHLDYSPIKVQRSRQFSQIRQGHTNRPKTSNLTTQRNANDSRRQPPQSRNNNNVSRFQPNNRSQMTLSPSKVVCVGCFNKQMYQAKLQKKRQQNSQNQQPTNVSLINTDDPYHNQAKSRYNRELELTKMYNKQQMNKNRQKMERQRQEKERSVMENQQLIDQNRELQKKRAEMQHERVQQLRKQLRSQIEKKKQKDEEYKNQLKQPVDGIFGEPNKAVIQHQMQQKYKKDLKDQIAKNKQIRMMRQQEENQRKKEAEARMLLEAADREKARKQRNQLRQKTIEDDYRKHKQYEEIQIKKRRNQQQEQEQLARQTLNEFLEEKRQQDQLKRKKLDRYVEDLKKQMAIDEAKKKKEYSWLHEPTKTTLIEKDPAPERNCDSCEKRYPQSYLTRITSPIKY